MPANLPPQFFQLQNKLKEVKTLEEKIEILKEMLAVCPKHKGTEKVQEEIKRKIAKLKREVPKKIKREEIYFVKKEGAGQVLVLGPPNSGKTSLVNKLCQTNFKVADFPFTTKIPTPAMMKFENILIQIVDTPPLWQGFKPGWLKNLSKQANLILLLVDLSQDFKSQTKELLEIMQEWQIEKEKIFIVGNKIDIAPPNLKTETFSISAKVGTNLEKLKEKIFKNLRIIRVYAKEPKKEVNFDHPFILKEGTKLIEFVEEINEEWIKKFKGAKLYSTDLKHFIMVGREYILKDGDIIEIKI